jgi:hypothetical protein
MLDGRVRGSEVFVTCWIPACAGMTVSVTPISGATACTAATERSPDGQFSRFLTAGTRPEKWPVPRVHCGDDRRRKAVEANSGDDFALFCLRIHFALCKAARADRMGVFPTWIVPGSSPRGSNGFCSLAVTNAFACQFCRRCKFPPNEQEKRRRGETEKAAFLAQSEPSPRNAKVRSAHTYLWRLSCLVVAVCRR